MTSHVLEADSWAVLLWPVIRVPAGRSSSDCFPAQKKMIAEGPKHLLGREDMGTPLEITQRGSINVQVLSFVMNSCELCC